MAGGRVELLFLSLAPFPVMTLTDSQRSAVSMIRSEDKKIRLNAARIFANLLRDDICIVNA